MRAARLVPVISLVLAFFPLTQPLMAQSVYGSVWGRLTSPAGTPVSAALVSITAVQTDANFQTKTDASGNFAVNNLTPDLYQVEIRADGFKRVSGTVQISADSTATVDSTLQPGDPTVLAQSSTASGSILKLDRTDVSTLFDSLSIDDLPLYNLNVTELPSLVPGASVGKLFIAADQNPQNGLPTNINGQNFSGTSFQLDGTEDRDPLQGIVVINPPLDSVGEVKVTTQGYNAEFGTATAGIVTIQTRTGSNTWHGDGFGYRRTGFGQADNPFDPEGVPPSKYSVFGGSVGGPIVRNKLFLFGDYQGTRSSQGASLLLSVPPMTVKESCLGSAGTMGSLCNLSAYSQFIAAEQTGVNPGGPTTLVDPYNNSAQYMCLQGGQSVPCNEIPNTSTPGTTNITDQAVALLKLMPDPTPGLAADPNCIGSTGETVCNNFVASGQEAFNANQFDVRADFNASSRFRLFGRYSFGQFYDSGDPAFGGTQGGGLGTNPNGFAGVAETRNQGISSGFTYTLGPKLLTDFRFGYFRYRLNVNAPTFDLSSLGIPGISQADTGNPFATSLPDFEIPALPGFSGDYLRLGYSPSANNCNCPLREQEQQFQLVNNWTWAVGNHSVKWGADLRFLQNYRFASQRPPTGFFSFAPSETGLGLATLLIGEVTSFDRTVSSPAALNAGEHQKRFGFYGQDTWRVNSRLTVNYGLRWEIYFPQTVTNAGGFLVPNFNDPDPTTAFFTGPPAGGISGNLSNFAPRLGFAYLINPTTVVRAGYGRGFDAGYAGDLFGIAATQNPPVTVLQNIQGGGFNLRDGPPEFVFPNAPVSLLDLAAANIGDPNHVEDGVPTPIPPSGAQLYALPSKVRVPTVDSWNVTVQHELSSHLFFELAYVGNKGTYVFTDTSSGATSYALSQPSLQNLIVQTIQNGQRTSFSYTNCKGSNAKGTKGSIFNYGEQQYCLSVPQIRSFYPQVEIPNDPCPTPTLQNQKCYFDPTLFPLNYFGNNASNNYNSLQAKVRKTFSRGYSFLAHYTWSKGFDYDDNYFGSDPRSGYGPASFDVRNRFVMTNVWDLPIGRGRAWLGGVGPVANRFVGGWTISAITIWQSGLPFTPTYLQNSCANDTDAGGQPCRPNLVGSVSITGNREQYFTTTGGINLPCVDPALNPKFCGVDQNGQPAPGTQEGPWQRPGAGQIGTVGRNSFSGPGFFQSDIGLAKTISMTERTALRFQVEAFNAFNRVNMGQPNTCVDCQVGAGQITSLASGAIQRKLQFSARIDF